MVSNPSPQKGSSIPASQLKSSLNPVIMLFIFSVPHYVFRTHLVGVNRDRGLIWEGGLFNLAKTVGE